MGLFKKIFDKMGNSHIRMLTKDCALLIVNKLLLLEKQGKSPDINFALDILIHEARYTTIQKNKYKNLRQKFSDFFIFYVTRNLGREFDISAEFEILSEEIQKYWDIIINKFPSGWDEENPLAV